MSKKRTRAQKARAHYHYAMPAAHSFSGLKEEEKITPPNSGTKQIVSNITSLYSYDPAFITKDIRHTLLVSILIVCLQLGIYFWLK